MNEIITGMVQAFTGHTIEPPTFVARDRDHDNDAMFELAKVLLASLVDAYPPPDPYTPPVPVAPQQGGRRTIMVRAHTRQVGRGGGGVQRMCIDDDDGEEETPEEAEARALSRNRRELAAMQHRIEAQEEAAAERRVRARKAAAELQAAEARIEALAQAKALSAAAQARALQDAEDDRIMAAIMARRAARLGPMP